MNKPKLNEPNVKTTLTTFNSETGESITINKIIPSQQFKDVVVTGMVASVIKQNPTEEEVKKEWEELGYEWRIPKEYPHMIWLVNDDEAEKWVLTIKINTQSKKFWKKWGDLCIEPFTFEEHQLLTKTFKALGWYDE